MIIDKTISMRFLILLITVYSVNISYAFENDLAAICVRPNSNELYVGGEFNTIFVVDKNNGEEIRRLKTENGALDMQFNQDGSKLIVFDGNTVNFTDPVSGDVSYTLKASNVRLFEKAPYFIDADWLFSKSVVVYSTEDGSEVFKYTPEFTPLDAGFDPEFKELIVLGREMDIKGEGKLITEKIEESDSYNVYNKAYVEQQSDKKGAGFLVLSMETKSPVLESIIPYKTAKSFGLSISKYNDQYYISCWDMFLKVDQEGLAHPISCSDAGFAYATNAVLGSKSILISSTKEGVMFKIDEERFVGFNAKKDNEFAYSVDITDDGDLIYMLNKDYTVSILNEKAMVTNRLKIDNSTGNGFGVYYTNGYNKKEDRDKEAAIINAELKSLGLPEIDLEAYVGESSVLIGTFETVQKAEAFKAKISKNGLSYLTKIAPIE